MKGKYRYVSKYVCTGVGLYMCIVGVSGLALHTGTWDYAGLKNIIYRMTGPSSTFAPPITVGETFHNIVS